jgi:monoamine oxidase
MADADVIILGAGAAGLSAAGALAQSGLEVTVIEARDRLGGRIFTRHLPSGGLPVELGAEFVHGRPREIWELVESAHLKTHEVGGDSWCHREGRLEPCPKHRSRIDRLFARMSAIKGDRTFQEFLDSDADSESKDLKSQATAFVEGFNAAHASRVSVRWLIDSRKADQAIEADRAYRLVDGYGALVAKLAERVENGACDLRLETPVRAIRWRRGRVSVVTRAGEVLRARRAVISLPLGVLQAPAGASGEVTFDPDITAKRAALARIAMGTVVRVALVFREPFWESLERSGRSLSRLSFLHSDVGWFRTWWTRMPARSAILTGWSAGGRAEGLCGADEPSIVERALSSLSDTLGMSRPVLSSLFDQACFHDWQADPFSRGAYSYVLAGGAEAPRELGAPLEETLFFAGEATDTTGHNGTVHGAIASGRRAVRDVLASLGR